MKSAFGFSIGQYVYYRGHPGSALLIDDDGRWKSRIRDSLVETAIFRDILMMTRINKPAPLNNLFEIGCEHSGSILSFNKMLGQLQDAGNTVTLSHSPDLLDSAGILTGLRKYSTLALSKRTSSPRLQVLNTASISSHPPGRFADVRNDFDRWGRPVESSVCAHLSNISRGNDTRLFYQREREEIAGIEVKTGRRKESLPGMGDFTKSFPVKKALLAGAGGLSHEEFFSYSPDDIMG
ncbi:MAG TPA: hypothetical protein VLM75_05995 [Spirochaetota bacterium]|nr:hypothetical protein [Spirochaetota bacterium]